MTLIPKKGTTVKRQDGASVVHADSVSIVHAKPSQLCTRMPFCMRIRLNMRLRPGRETISVVHADASEAEDEEEEDKEEEWDDEGGRGGAG